jgi:DNA polymerase-3 subunit delta
MKLTFRDIEGFVKKPNPVARVCVVYGPDQGLVVERAKTIAKTQTPDLNDPFNVSLLDARQIIDDPARLNDEAFAQSLMGGQRLVYIKDGADGLTPVLKDYLNAPSMHTLVVIEASALGTQSSLRALTEKAQNAVAIPCYVEDERDLTRFIQAEITAAGYTIDRDAMALLAGSLVGDRRVARAELEKLLIYKWSDADKAIKLADVEACAGDVRQRTFDELVHAVGSGNVSVMAASLSALTRENTAAVAILRTIQNHFRKLYQVQLKMESGLDPKAAMKSIHPPVFFKYEDSFINQTRRWPRPRIEQLLNALNTVEAMTKQTNMPSDTLTAQLLLKTTLQKAA